MDIAPGVKLTVNKSDQEEVDRLRAKIAQQKLDQISDEEARRIEILREVYETIRADEGPIRITEEMTELGIDQQVWSMIQNAEISRGMMRSLHDEDDDEVGSLFAD